jgi:hypothetical protein
VRPASVIALLAVSAGAIAVRRPDVFTRPQFWAEDGMVWFALAYNEPGMDGLLRPYGGYVQTFPRLAGILCQLVDVASAPLLMALLALGIQMVAPVFLLSDRFAWAVPRPVTRVALAVLLVAVPNLMEVHVNVTNSQVQLGILALLVLLAESRASRAWRAFDVGCLLLSGLSGPFCVLLLPAAALCWWHWRDRWSALRLLCVLAPALLQATVLLAPRGALPVLNTSAGMGVRSPLTSHGATLENLLAIFGGHIVVGGVAGLGEYARLHAGAFAEHPWLPVAIGLAGVLFLARAAWVTTSFALRMLLLFATLHMAAGLSSPIIFGDRPLWVLLQIPGAGQRYYYSMILAFLATIVWTVAADPRPAARGLAVALLVVLVTVGIPRDFVLPPRADHDFPAHAARLAASPPGTRVRIPIPPAPMDMVLIRDCEPPHVPLTPR